MPSIIIFRLLTESLDDCIIKSQYYSYSMEVVFMKLKRCMPENLAENRMFAYGLLNSRNNGKSLKDVDSREELHTTGFLLGYDDRSEKSLMAIILESGDILYTVSNTFITMFLDCVDTLETCDLRFRVGHELNRKDREYITFILSY